MNEIFQSIRDQAERVKDKVQQRLLNKNDYEFKKYQDKRESINKLKAEVEEATKFLTTSGWIHYKNFLLESQKMLQENLQSIGIRANTKDELVLQVTRISAQLELLDLLLNRPKKIIELLKTSSLTERE